MARPRTSPLARLWSRVKRGDGCWLWPGYCNADGHGIIKEGDQRHFVHRLAYQEAFGLSLSPDDVVRHACDTPNCVNPAHLQLGTHADNVADRVSRGRSATGPANGRFVHGRHCKQSFA